MKHTLTVCMITSREEPQLDWLVDSMRPQLSDGETLPPTLLISAVPQYFNYPPYPDVRVMYPKPTIWQGPHRKTREDWWAASNARNTALCLAKTDWLLMVDDRCILGPDSLTAIRDAMEGGYAVAGAYEKRHHMKVENGVITDPGILDGTDHRIAHVSGNGPAPCPGNWCYGAMALPLEWALTVGGYEEALDGLGFEDVILGLMLQNNNFKRCYDPRFKMIQDRTPEKCGKTPRREDFGSGREDKSHRSLDLFGCAMHTTNRHMLWQSRQAVQAGKPFPTNLGSQFDWWDGQPIDEEYPRNNTHQ